MSRHLLGSFRAELPRACTETVLSESRDTRTTGIHSCTCIRTRLPAGPNGSVAKVMFLRGGCRSCAALCLAPLHCPCPHLSLWQGSPRSTLGDAAIVTDATCGRLQSAGRHSAGARALAHECTTSADPEIIRRYPQIASVASVGSGSIKPMQKFHFLMVVFLTQDQS